VTRDDEEALVRIMDEESEGGPLIIANDIAIEIIKDRIGDCQCEGCRFLSQSLSLGLAMENLH